jgi:SAM-dependent methyltransferase
MSGFLLRDARLNVGRPFEVESLCSEILVFCTLHSLTRVTMTIRLASKLPSTSTLDEEMSGPVLRPPEDLQKCLLENDRSPDPDHTLAAIKHRQRLVRFWGLTRGARILEIGCGQGDCTVVLADAVGPQGLVVGIDPGPDDYGIPSLGRAHKHVKASVVGKQIEFVRSDAAGYLTSPTLAHRFDFIVLAHCVWYLAEPGLLTEIFELARR